MLAFDAKTPTRSFLQIVYNENYQVPLTSTSIGFEMRIERGACAKAVFFFLFQKKENLLQCALDF